MVASIRLQPKQTLTIDCLSISLPPSMTCLLSAIISMIKSLGNLFHPQSFVLAMEVLLPVASAILVKESEGIASVKSA